MFKVRLKERIFIIFFACFLAIYPPTVKFQEVQALEWAIPTVAFDTALKFLLGLLGVSITSKALHDNVDWNQVQQDAMNYQIQKGNDAVAVGEWWEDVAKGTLNQASACWFAFKEWVQSMLDSTVTVDSINGAISSVVDITTPIASNYEFAFDSAFYIKTRSGAYTFYFFKDFTVNYITASRISLLGKNSTYAYFQVDSSGIVSRSSRVDNVGGAYNVDLPSTAEVYLFNFDAYLEDSANFYLWNLALSDIFFQSANENIQDTAITTDDTTTTAIPDTLPLPWDNVSDTAEGVSDAIDAVQELVAEGVISLEEYWERVQEMINALAIDTATEETLPVTQNPDTGENEKLPDKVQENVSNTTFTLNGLEKVFPFCIPWDIYGFVTLLVAEPVAPVINYPIYNPVTNQNINITIDFSDWETVVVLFRYILDFLLIIGLLLLARQLSGAGGDD